MIDDKTLRQHVLDELAWDARVNATHVAMTASGGTVTLTGHMPTYTQLFAAAKAMQHVQGVKAVADDLLARLADSECRADETNATSDEVILDGNEQAFYEGNLVEAACWLAPGVRKVTDRISVG